MTATRTVAAEVTPGGAAATTGNGSIEAPEPPPVADGNDLVAMLAESYHSVIAASTASEVMRRASEAARQLLSNDVGWYAKRHGDELRITGQSGLRGPQMAEHWTVPVGLGIGGRVVDHGQTVVVRDYRHDRRRTAKVKSLLDSEGIVSGVVAPVPIGKCLAGAIYSGSRTQRSFSPQAVEAVTILGRVAGTTLAAIETNERLRTRVTQIELEAEHLRVAAEAASDISKELAVSTTLSSGLRRLAEHLDARVELNDSFAEPLAAAGESRHQQLSAEMAIPTGRRALADLRVFSDGPLSSSQQATLRYVGNALALRLLRDQAVLETERRLNTKFFDGLLLGDERDEQHIMHEASLLGFDLRNRVVVCVGRRRVSTVPGEIPSATGEVGAALATAVQKQARMLDPDPIVTLHSGLVVVLLDTSESDVGALADGVSRLLEGCAGSDLVAGVGSSCFTSRDYAASYREARFALEMACDRADGYSTCTIAEIGVLGLFAHAADRRLLEERARACVAPLFDAGAEHLVTTLRSYFANNRNLEKTAAHLFLHVNTVRHRLNKAEELLGIDLKNGEQRFLLELAVRVRGVMAALDPDAGPDPHQPA